MFFVKQEVRQFIGTSLLKFSTSRLCSHFKTSGRATDKCTNLKPNGPNEVLIFAQLWALIHPFLSVGEQNALEIN